MRAFKTFLLVAALAMAPQIARADDQKPDAKPDSSQPGTPKPAESKPHAGKKHERKDLAERLREPLGLTDEQVKKIRAIEEEAHAQAKKERQADKGNKEDRKKIAKETQEKIREGIRSVLTDEQKAKLEAFLKKEGEGKKKRKDKEQNGTAPAPKPATPGDTKPADKDPN
jgi:Spy/CpxP family protein refolding chaperone